MKVIRIMLGIGRPDSGRQPRSRAGNRPATRLRHPLPASVIRLLAALALPVFFWAPLPAQAAPALQADQIIVRKAERKLYLIRQGEPLKWFWVALGRYPDGHKTELGDGRTPEGTYRITGRAADSTFYRALYLSYPNSADRARAQRLGVHPGGGIMIHALPKGYGPTGPGERMFDWTNGCIAVTNADMDEIWARVPDGIPVVIRP